MSRCECYRCQVQRGETKCYQCNRGDVACSSHRQMVRDTLDVPPLPEPVEALTADEAALRRIEARDAEVETRYREAMKEISSRSRTGTQCQVNLGGNVGKLVARRLTREHGFHCYESGEVTWNHAIVRVERQMGRRPNALVEFIRSPLAKRLAVAGPVIGLLLFLMAWIWSF